MSQALKKNSGTAGVTQEELDRFVVHESANKSGLETVIDDPKFMHKVSVDCLPVNMPLPSPVYAYIGGKFVMFRQENDLISEERVVLLKKMGSDSVFIPKIYWHKLIRALEELVLPEHCSAEDRVRHIRALLLAYNDEMERADKPPTRSILERLQKLAGELAEEIHYRPEGALKQLRKHSDPSLYFVNHSVNTAIYSALMGGALKYPLSDIKTLTFACMVHDIGNSFIPHEVLHKKDKLTQEEFDLMKTHTIQGAELLQQCGMPPAVIIVAYQHHERNDGKGYPKQVPGRKIHPFAKICAIADVYDAITSNRPHQQGLSATEAMNRMRAQEGLFDMDFLERIRFSVK